MEGLRPPAHEHEDHLLSPRAGLPAAGAARGGQRQRTGEVPVRTTRPGRRRARVGVRHRQPGRHRSPGRRRRGLEWRLQRGRPPHGGRYHVRLPGGAREVSSLRRLFAGVCCVAAGSGAWAVSARADVVITTSPGTFTATVQPSSDTRSHEFSVQAYEDQPLFSSVRRGVRFQQLQSGDPSIAASSGQLCDNNPAFNDVVCHDDRGLAGPDTINGGAGNDVFRFVDSSLLDRVCVPGTRPTTHVTVNLGGDDDTVSVDNTDEVCGSGQVEALIEGNRVTELNPVLNANGGTGDDHLTGGFGPDTLQGGPGNDSIAGNAGNDNLFGGTGNDNITGGDGNDTFTPDDTIGSDGADTFSGGPGFDTVNYGSRTVPLTITVGDGQANDGAAGENDGISDAEEIIGGSANDTIVGSSAGETLIGGGGADVLRGGGGDDTIGAVDGQHDSVSCGSGKDVAN